MRGAEGLDGHRISVGGSEILFIESVLEMDREVLQEWQGLVSRERGRIRIAGVEAFVAETRFRASWLRTAM